MERTNEFDFYKLGQRLQRISSIRGETPVTSIWWELYDAHRALGELLDGKPCPLSLSRNKALEAFRNLGGTVDRYLYVEKEDGTREFKFPEVNDPRTVSEWQFDMVRRSISEFETVFAEEMREAATYRVPDRGIFSIPKLVDFADQAFPAELREHIPEKTSTDWKAAGRCLAFNLCTASGFHVARAVEGTIEAYYQAFCKKQNTLKSLNDYVKALEAVATDPKPNDKVVAELRQLKDDWRNPLMHPRVVLTETDARMLFAKGEGLIMGMAQELRELAKASTPPLLTQAAAAKAIEAYSSQ